jgi:hypothetical protein
LYGENLKLVKEVPLFPKKYPKINIWHSPKLMPARSFPHLLIFEDNWGFDREKLLPPFIRPGMNYSTAWNEHYTLSDNPNRRTIVYNVLTEKIEWEFNGIFSAELLAQNLVRIPNVVKSGKVGCSLVRGGEEIAFLPYASFLPKKYYHFLNCSSQISASRDYGHMWSPYAFSDCIIGTDRFSVIDYENMLLKRPALNAPLDNKTFYPIVIDLITLTTGEYKKDGLVYRDFIILSGKRAKHPFTVMKIVTVPTKDIGKVEGNCFAWMSVRGL